MATLTDCIPLFETRVNDALARYEKNLDNRCLDWMETYGMSPALSEKRD